MYKSNFIAIVYLNEILTSEIILALKNSQKNVEINNFGKIYCWGENLDICEQSVFGILELLENKFGEIDIIAIGEQDKSGKSSIFVSRFEHITTVLSKEIEMIINELGLTSASTDTLSKVVAHELLKKIAIKNKIDRGYSHLNESINFSHWFVIDEKIKQKMIDTYRDEMDNYIDKYYDNKSRLKNLISSITNNKEDIVKSIISGIIIELCMRVIINLNTYLHSEKGEIDIIDYNLPKKLYDKIQSGEAFKISEISKKIGINEISLILILNSLIEPNVIEIIDENKEIYKGTGKTTVPNVMGSYNPGPKEKAIKSDIFINEMKLLTIPYIKQEWLPDRNLLKIYEKLEKRTIYK